MYCNALFYTCQEGLHSYCAYHIPGIGFTAMCIDLTALQTDLPMDFFCLNTKPTTISVGSKHKMLLIKAVFCYLCVDSTLEGYERMRDDRQWGAVIAGLEENSWFAHKEQAAAAFKRELSTLSRAGTRLLPASVARRLLACFSPLVGWLTPTTCPASICW